MTSAKRLPSLPDLPSIAESGLPAYDISGWYGVLAPAGTPKQLVTRLNIDIVTALRLPDVTAQMAGMGLEITTSTPEEFGMYIKTEIAKWTQVIKDSGARAD